MDEGAYSTFSLWYLFRPDGGDGVPDVTPTCPECERLRARVRELQDERDAALLSVSREREKANAILTSQVALAPPPPKPIRYWAVDLLNDGVKRVLPWPHAGVRAAAALLRRLRKEAP
jgi:hypothetical protein